MASDDKNEIAEIKDKLDTVIRLLATNIVSQDESLREQATKLSNAGLRSKDIAFVLDTTTNNVNVALHNARKAKASNGKKSSKKKTSRQRGS